MRSALLYLLALAFVLGGINRLEAADSPAWGPRPVLGTTKTGNWSTLMGNWTISTSGIVSYSAINWSTGSERKATVYGPGRWHSGGNDYYVIYTYVHDVIPRAVDLTYGEYVAWIAGWQTPVGIVPGVHDPTAAVYMSGLGVYRVPAIKYEFGTSFQGEWTLAGLVLTVTPQSVHRDCSAYDEPNN